MRRAVLAFIASGMLGPGCRGSLGGLDTGGGLPEPVAEVRGEDVLPDPTDTAVQDPTGHSGEVTTTGSGDSREAGFPDDVPADAGEVDSEDDRLGRLSGPGEPCVAQEDCVQGLFCDDAMGICVACRQSRDCPFGEFCLDHTCVPWLCFPGSATCEGSILKTCGPDGEGFVSERDCDDHDPCTEGDGCMDRRCVNGVPRECDDGDPCTVDACDAEAGCVHVAVEGPTCDDYDPCTTGDVCGLEGCRGLPRDCSDGNPCTDDYCDPARGCVHYPNQAFCDDQDPCTWAESCRLGVCEGLSLDCNDGEPCTSDHCELGTCLHSAIPYCGPCPDDTWCDDGNPCSRDLCISGSCEHLPMGAPGCCGDDRDCEDQDPCTVETCTGGPFGTCRIRAVPEPACCSTLTFSAGFPAGDLQGFDLDPPSGQVGWHLIETGLSTSPPWSLYYGNPDTNDYSTDDSANSGSVWSPEVLLPARVGLALQFWVWMDVEPGEAVDAMTVAAVADSGEFLLWRKPSGFLMKAWQEVLVDISALQARPVRFRFTFDTQDGIGNGGRGVYLDDIRVTSTCKPVPCTSDLDCRSVGMVGTCVSSECDFREVLKAVGSFGEQGTGPGQFQTPFDVTTDGDVVMVSDRDNHRVQVFALDGTYRFAWGKPGTGDGQFQSPHGLVLSGDRVYVADTGNHRVQVFTTMGIFLFAFGSLGSEPGRLNEPKDVAVTGDGGAVYVADTSNHRVQVFGPDGDPVLAFGEYGKKPGQFRSPSCVVLTSDFRVLVCDTQNQRVQVLTWQGEPITSLQGTGDLALDAPYGAALLPDGGVTVADTLHHRLVTFSDSGQPRATFGTFGLGVGEFRYPMGLAVSADGRLLVADASNHRIVLVTKTAFP